MLIPPTMFWMSRMTSRITPPCAHALVYGVNAEPPLNRSAHTATRNSISAPHRRELAALNNPHVGLVERLAVLLDVHCTLQTVETFDGMQLFGDRITGQIR